jgi:hypothetical protein
MTRAAECRNARDATVRAGSDVAPASMGEGHSARVSAVLPVLVRIGTLGAAADPFETPAFPTRQEAEIVTGEPAIEGEGASGGTIGRASAARFNRSGRR